VPLAKTKDAAMQIALVQIVTAATIVHAQHATKLVSIPKRLLGDF